MSIWTELLVFHGHVATPAALALIAPVAACAAAASPSAPPAPADPRAPGPPQAAAGEPYHHPLRTVGQLR
jgi:hypothetical protein